MSSPSSLFHRRMVFVQGQVSASGDNTASIAAPPAGSENVISIFLVQNASSTATTILAKAGASSFFRFLAQNQGDGVAWVFPEGKEIRLGDGNGLVLNLSGANAFNFTFGYWVEPAIKGLAQV